MYVFRLRASPSMGQPHQAENPKAAGHDSDKEGHALGCEEPVGDSHEKVPEHEGRAEVDPLRIHKDEQVNDDAA